MAKQKHGQSGSRPDRQQRRHSPAAIACPSSSVLSILATIAASSHSVDGSPLPFPTPPPSFLCPFIDHVNICVRNPTPTTSYSSITTTSSASPTTTTQHSPQVADKYVQGPDGRWHKADAWTLYGSTVRSLPLSSFHALISVSSAVHHLPTLQSMMIHSPPRFLFQPFPPKWIPSFLRVGPQHLQPIAPTPSSSSH